MVRQRDPDTKPKKSLPHDLTKQKPAVKKGSSKTLRKPAAVMKRPGKKQ